MLKKKQIAIGVKIATLQSYIDKLSSDDDVMTHVKATELLADIAGDIGYTCLVTAGNIIIKRK